MFQWEDEFKSIKMGSSGWLPINGMNPLFTLNELNESKECWANNRILTFNIHLIFRLIFFYSHTFLVFINILMLLLGTFIETSTIKETMDNLALVTWCDKKFETWSFIYPIRNIPFNLCAQSKLSNADCFSSIHTRLHMGTPQRARAIHGNSSTVKKCAICSWTPCKQEKKVKWFNTF